MKHPSLEKEIRGIRVGLIRNSPIIAKEKRSESNEELVSWHREKKLWSKARVDLTGPINEITYIVLTDSHSKWSEVIPGPSESNKAAISTIDHSELSPDYDSHIASSNASANPDFFFYMNSFYSCLVTTFVCLLLIAFSSRYFIHQSPLSRCCSSYAKYSFRNVDFHGNDELIREETVFP